MQSAAAHSQELSPMSGAGNPLNYDYRDPRQVVRYGKLVAAQS
jgi:hypothetical protein